MAKPFTDKQKDFLFDYMLEFFKERELNEKEEGFPRKPRDPEGAVIYEAKSNNAFMDMIGKALKDTASEGIKGVPTKKDLEKAKSLTPKEGIMTAQQYEQGGDLNYIIEMMKNETDPDKLEELKMQIREMLGTTPYMSIRQDPVRKAKDGGIMMLAQGGESDAEVKKPETEKKSIEEMLAELRKLLELDKKDK